MSEFGHTSVLLHESIDGLHIQSGDIYVDGTLGRAGHAEEVAKRFGKDVRIVGIDMDQAALTESEARLKKIAANATLVQGNFRTLDTILDSLGIDKVQRIMLDLGLSSNQLDQSGRGFSFQRDEPLHMTFSANPKSQTITAETIVNEWSEETLITILKGFGEEKFAGRIARAIVEAREVAPITTTGELVAVVGEVVPSWYKRQRIHFATRTFQALRIATNDELGALHEGLVRGFNRLTPGGRMAVISFHSLEDRIVKNYFKQLSQDKAAVLITKKPIVPAEQEMNTNRRSRSAKLRIIEKK